MANRMTKVLNKIERRLGLSMLPLPDKLSKDKWAEIIEEDTLLWISPRSFFVTLKKEFKSFINKPNSSLDWTIRSVFV